MSKKKSEILQDLQQWGIDEGQIPEDWQDLQAFYASVLERRDQSDGGGDDESASELDDAAAADEVQSESAASVEREAEAPAADTANDPQPVVDDPGELIEMDIGVDFNPLDWVVVGGRVHRAGQVSLKAGEEYKAGPKTAGYLVSYGVASRV